MPNTDMTQYDSKRRSSPHSYSVTPHDRELVAFIADYYGCGPSEAVRQSIRYMAERVAVLKDKTEG